MAAKGYFKGIPSVLTHETFLAVYITPIQTPRNQPEGQCWWRNTCKVCIIALTLFFPDFYTIDDIQLPSVEPKVLTDNLRHFFLLFSGTEGPPKGPRGSPMILNGQTIVP